MRSLTILAWAACGVLLAGPPPARAQAPAPDAPAAGPERITFDEAVARALQRNPNVREAAQQILRAQALFQQARAAVLPTLYAGAGTVVLDAARGFDGQVTQPRTQSAFNATLSVPVLAASSWAEKNRFADQVRIANISAEETRRQVAYTAAQAYLAVIAARRQQEIARQNLDTARALEEYASARLEAGKGSRVNHVRSTQERASAEALLHATQLAILQAEEALGVAVFADGPKDASSDPELRPAAAPVERSVARGAARRSPVHGPGSRPPSASRRRPGRCGSRPSTPASPRSTSPRRVSSSPRTRGARSSSCACRSSTGRCTRRGSCASPTRSRPASASTP